MELTTLIVLLFGLLAAPVFFLFAPRFSAGLMAPTYEREVKTLIQGPRHGVNVEDPQAYLIRSKKRKAVIGKLADTARKRTSTSRLTIAKRLRYAQWPISAVLFHAIELGVSATLFTITHFYLGSIIQYLLVFSGPIILRSALNFAVDRRFKKFDADFPQFMMSIVGLLKTGMAPINAIESASLGLDPTSLVRSEVYTMVERMRIGIPEERSIGAFGENINHAEIELFIQALLLSKRVGGGLSDTLERLSRQVRKRQFFRSSANAAVALQRASLWMILGILVSLELYIYKMYPPLVVEVIYDATGWIVAQCAVVAICVGILWSRQVTKIKV